MPEGAEFVCLCALCQGPTPFLQTVHLDASVAPHQVQMGGFQRLNLKPT